MPLSCRRRRCVVSAFAAVVVGSRPGLPCLRGPRRRDGRLATRPANPSQLEHRGAAPAEVYDRVGRRDEALELLQRPWPGRRWTPSIAAAWPTLYGARASVRRRWDRYKTPWCSIPATIGPERYARWTRTLRPPELAVRIARTHPAPRRQCASWLMLRAHARRSGRAERATGRSRSRHRSQSALHRGLRHEGFVSGRAKRYDKARKRDRRRCGMARCRCCCVAGPPGSRRSPDN